MGPLMPSMSSLPRKSGKSSSTRKKALPRLAERRSWPRDSAYHRDRVWRAIESTPNFWTTLKPLENGAVERLYQLTGEHNWEVFFITQRPATAGGTVQWQTHKWLVEQGFLMPSVIPLSGGRGKAAAALRLDYLVDDTPQNCVDVLSDSSTRAILLVDTRGCARCEQRQAAWNRNGALHS